MILAFKRGELEHFFQLQKEKAENSADFFLNFCISIKNKGSTAYNTRKKTLKTSFSVLSCLVMPIFNAGQHGCPQQLVYTKKCHINTFFAI